jgi:hypothetical protein
LFENENVYSNDRVESAINSFNEELDSLIRSLDVLSQSKPRTKTPPHYIDNTEQQSRHNIDPPRSRYDPPQSVDKPSPLRFSSNSTPQRLKRNTTDNQNYGTSARTRFNNNESVSSFYSPKPVETPIATARSTKTNNDYRTPREERSVSEKEDWELATSIREMKQILQQQEMKIQALQKEKEDLRRQLSMAEKKSSSRGTSYYKTPSPPSPYYCSEYSTTQSSIKKQPPPAAYDENNDQFAAGSEGSHRIDVISKRYEEFTPGTKFVAVRTVYYSFSFHYLIEYLMYSLIFSNC